MISMQKHLLVGCFGLMLSQMVLAQAPVVDASDNFAIVSEQQAAEQAPVAQPAMNDVDYSDEPALAKDDNPNPKGNLAQENAALLDKVQGLQQEIQELRGQLEVQAHDLKLLQQQQLAFYKDLDGRLRGAAPKTAASSKPESIAVGEPNPAAVAKLDPVKAKTEAVVTPVTSPKPNNAANLANPADEQISYLAAYDLVKSKRYDQAIQAMQTFIKQYPQGGYTANAWYWLGELYLVKGDYAKANQHFNQVIKEFPTSSKAAPSMLKSGYALAAAGKQDEARRRLKQVMKDYPDTQSAKLASTKLEMLETL